MIQLQNVSFAYRKKPVFDELNLQFTAGHVYGLLGKNGTGKSSLLRNIAGLLQPQKGVIRVNGFAPFDRLPAFLEDVFMVPEEFYLPDISIAAFIKHYAPFYARFNADQFKNFVSVFQIPLDSTLQNMSYGQKKKVLISFALATNARVLLMDEPTNGLDILSKSQFRKILAEALDEERCIIISTHQVKDLENLIDRITIIDEGRILFDETVETITKKLTFRFAYDASEVVTALYSESSLAGSVIVAPNTNGEESKLDLELLYKAIVTNSAQITKLFES
ncbi:MAG TPA: ATP-binding cassette domain-containing protein [Flavisolibacter sp.]|jgi:ABC-2 type transport system ATP-binding protein|nr:ATP-binding cassette domain-containing protein [Flavisolibacter sp.]